MEDWQNAGFGLYLHWPFCQAKCPYCDFNSHVSDHVDQRRWLSAFRSEIARYGALTGGRVLSTIFFGGGTPSLMHPDTVAGILEAAQETWTWANDIEISLEANPTSIEAAKFDAFRDAGVNRVSMGMQALNDADLKRLGRLHSVDDGKRAFEIARNSFDRVSFDLIYARQDQTLADWEIELREALSMAVDHLSLYQLTIESGTAFGARYDRGLLRGLPDEDASADMYELTQALCADHGFPSYEVSNHAKNGAISKHNMIYWTYGDYVGIGPGAHGRVTVEGQKMATTTPLMPSKWLNQVEKTGAGDAEVETVSAEDQAVEMLMMGLRVNQGVDLIRLGDLGKKENFLNNINNLEEMNLLERGSGHLRVTPKGRPLLNAVLRDLLVD
ncbi:radical SAM family heme chaperone HemW [Cognatishimia sp. MH4019]|uniref:radical SAM family heme chaperone HemW n=1 Tax=Cognatishimia sp. MH4019 TaxID=2854030 RepID=UPI001CD2EC9E